MKIGKVGLLGGGNCHALALARVCAARGIDCFGIGRARPKPAPLWQAPAGYRYYAAHLGRDLIQALEVLDEERPDTLVCIAAQGESSASFGRDAWMFFHTNCTILVRLVEALRAVAWLKRFVQISTSELYGSVASPVDEAAPVRPTSPYAASKAAFDCHLQAMHRVHGFPALILRPSNAYCEGQQLHRIVPRAAIAAAYGQRLRLNGGGSAIKSYLHSEDVATAVLALIEHGARGEIYNAGPALPIDIRTLVAGVAVAAEVAFEDLVEPAPARSGEDSMYWLDSQKLHGLGWKPAVGLDTGIPRMLAWARAYPELATMPAEIRLTP